MQNTYPRIVYILSTIFLHHSPLMINTFMIKCGNGFNKHYHECFKPSIYRSTFVIHLCINKNLQKIFNNHFFINKHLKDGKSLYIIMKSFSLLGDVDPLRKAVKHRIRYLINIY